MTIIDGGLRAGVFEVHEGAKVVLASVTVRNGNVGGGVVNRGDLTIQQSAIENNSSKIGGGIANFGSLVVDRAWIMANGSGVQGFGGGIANFGDATIVNSTILDNQSGAGSMGGGIYTQQGTVQITSSTIARNTSGAMGRGGGVYVVDGNVQITNSTVSLNGSGASGSGGGIEIAAGSVTIVSTTVYRNEATAGGSGGGINNVAGSLSLANSIVAQNDIGQIVGEYFDRGYNFTEGDPLLSPLQDNGGPTPTHLPLLGSPVIDRGNAFHLTTDQRGMPRTFDDPRVENWGQIIVGKDDDEEEEEDDDDGQLCPAWPCVVSVASDGTDIGAVEARYELLGPEAYNDAYHTFGVFLSNSLSDQPHSVLDNDFANHPLSAVLVTGPQNGQLQLAADGTFSYLPNAGFLGTDSFTYLASDGTDSSAPATVSIEIIQPSSISGVSYLDLDQDGIFDSNDVGLSQIQIILSGSDVWGINVSRTASTNSHGQYRFEDLAPGEYVVQQIQPTELPDGEDTIGSAGGDAEFNDQFTLLLTAGTNAEGYNFGELWDETVDPSLVVLPATGEIRHVGDANHDGHFDSSDFVTVFAAGEYSDAIEDNSSFDEGDWNGDGDFDSADFVMAFQAGNYEVGASLAEVAAAVDEIFADVATGKSKRAFVA